MSQEFHLSKPKLALTELGIQLMVPECLENNPQMILMLLLRLGVDQDVVNKYHNKVIQIGLEYPMQEIHEYRWGIRQPERHHCKLKMPIPRSKRYLRDICLPNPQLMVTGTKVYRRVDSHPSQLVKQVINSQ